VDVPLSLSRIIMKCLEKSAEERYHSEYGLKNDLEESLKLFEAPRMDTHVEPLFIPGLHDVYDQFQMPQKLYGREKEIERLLRIFESSSAGQAQMLLVKG
jgi:hypothetical protein